MVSKIFYLNSDKYPAIVDDCQQIKERVDKKKDSDYLCVFEALPPVRRTLSIPDKIKHGETTTALGMASLALINLPEDLRDIRGAYNQLKGAAPKYDHTICQHPFSFFRGTMLNDLADVNKASNKEFAKKLLKSDITLADTTFGKRTLKVLGVKPVDYVETQIKNIGHTEENAKYVTAKIYDGSKFGKLTAHAMERTTKWGLIVTALLETPKLAKAFCKGDSISEKADNGVKQVVKSAINVASITVGIGYMGAIGAQKFGAIGSLVGMGLGAVIGGYGSKKIQEIIA